MILCFSVKSEGFCQVSAYLAKPGNSLENFLDGAYLCTLQPKATGECTLHSIQLSIRGVSRSRLRF